MRRGYEDRSLKPQDAAVDPFHPLEILVQNTMSSTARRASQGAAATPATDSSGATATDGASDSSGVASASASTTRSVATGPSEVASRSVVALSSGEATPSVPAAFITRTEVDSPRSQRVARDRKVEQVDPGVTLSPPAKEVDAKHAAVAVQAITLSPASRQAQSALEQALEKFVDYYPSQDRSRRADLGFVAAHAALRQAATDFQESLDSRSPRQAQLADVVLKCLVDGLRSDQIQHPSALRSIALDISQCLELADALIDRLTPGVAESLKTPDGWFPDGYETYIWCGLVDASMSGPLGASFTTLEPSAQARARLSYLAELSLERPPLAQALGNARFSREPDTIRLARGMDRLGQAIVEHATVASAEKLSLVALKITAYVEGGEPKAGGRAWWKYALEPYFRGSLANDDPSATVVVIVGVVMKMSFWRRVHGSNPFADPASESPHRLNLDDMAVTFVKWASEASPERRALVTKALGVALDNFGKRPAASTDR